MSDPEQHFRPHDTGEGVDGEAEIRDDGALPDLLVAIIEAGFKPLAAMEQVLLKLAV